MAFFSKTITNVTREMVDVKKSKFLIFITKNATEAQILRNVNMNFLTRKASNDKLF